MKQLRFVLALLTAFTSIAVSAQVEGQDVSPTRSEMQPLHFDQPILADTLRISSIVPYSELQKSELPLLQSSYDHTSNYMLPIMPALKPYQLWDGTSVIVYGSNYLMLGLMDFQTSSLSLHQDFGRLQLSASATANKYWMPMEPTLHAIWYWWHNRLRHHQCRLAPCFRLLLCTEFPRGPSFQPLRQHDFFWRLCLYPFQRELWH